MRQMTDPSKELFASALFHQGGKGIDMNGRADQIGRKMMGTATN